jgi:hypothetical protein
MHPDVKIMLDEELAKRVVTVTFNKINGDRRVMDCTRNLDLVPPSMWPKNNVIEDQSRLSMLRVFDVKAQGWRSFSIDNVLELKSEHLHAVMSGL